MLGLWEYFWDTTAWVPAPPPALPEANEPRGSGKGRGKFVWEETADEEFWRVREEYLRSKLPPEEEIRKDAVEVQSLSETHKLAKLATERLNEYIKAQNAKTIQELETRSAIIQELTGQIINLKAQYDEEAILILLLDL